VVLIEADERDKLARIGGKVSVADETCKTVGNPIAAISAVLRIVVLPALSSRKTPATVHAPALLKAGNEMLTELDTERAGERSWDPR
jgi:hypothetical protein